ncbi:MAG: DUF2817 domain-containing protein [Rickettsiales bacterium]|nr:DUF2817 domain-containing protein [Rickettsiales bacterium]
MKKPADYFSKNWGDATVSFVAEASSLGTVKWQKHPESKFHIPYISLGNGADKVVINSGVHGAEGYFGSAAQLMIIRELIPNLPAEFFKKYTLGLIHVINGWGMENGMREVMDANGGLVDLNRNFCIDFSKPESLPQNELYKQAHDILMSSPKPINGVSKYDRLRIFRKEHPDVWAAISRGQYYEPLGLFYGGSYALPENHMTLAIYDEIMKDAASLTSIGLHTGVGRYYTGYGKTDKSLLVSHPLEHENTQKFAQLAGDTAAIVPYDGPALLGDLVDALEVRYEHMNIPVYTADFEVGTDETPNRSRILKFMDRGNARYEMMAVKENKGKKTGQKRIKTETARNLLLGWHYADDEVWQESALNNSHRFFEEVFKNLQKTL